MNTFDPAEREALEALTGHEFGNPGLLEQAITHRSAAGVGRHGYERLEFLGDRVLGMAVAWMVFRSFPDEAEGKLSMRLVELVRKETLADVARHLGLGDHIVMSRGEAQGGTRDSDTVLADVVEALIGALYLDGGVDTAFAFVERHWTERMTAHRKPPRDAKTRLQEWALARGYALPSYAMVDKVGPAHAPTITVEAVVEGLGTVSVEGPSRRVAEQEAAGQLLDMSLNKEMAS